MKIKKHAALPLTALAGLALLACRANAADILWIQGLFENEVIAAEWSTLLTTNGHTVTSFTGDRGLPEPADVAAVNAYDLVVVSRSAFFGSPTQIRYAGAKWNTEITAPLMMMQAYLIANHNGADWGWTTSSFGNGSPTREEPVVTIVNDETDAIWKGITVSNGNPTPGAIHERYARTLDLPLVDGGVVVASSPVGNALIARLPAGAPVTGGNLAGERMFFTMRGDSEDLTAFGEQVFLNAVESLTDSSSDPGTPFQVTITPNASTPGNYDFSWDSRADKIYDLVSSTSLTTAPSGWSVWDGQADVTSSGTTTTLENVPCGTDPRRFFAVIEK